MINIKKSAWTFSSLMITLLMVFVLFYGTFNYVSTNYNSVNVSMPLNYSQSYEDMQLAEGNLSNNVNDIRNSVQNISEADSSLATVAWNGLSGIASTLRLFLNIINVAVSVWNALLPGLSFLPTWLILLFELALIITIVLIILGAIKGESKT